MSEDLARKFADIQRQCSDEMDALCLLCIELAKRVHALEQRLNASQIQGPMI